MARRRAVSGGGVAGGGVAGGGAADAGVHHRRCGGRGVSVGAAGGRGTYVSESAQDPRARMNTRWVWYGRQVNDFHVTSNYSEAMGFSVLHTDDGGARVACRLNEQHMNSRGVCHGGVISGLMDMAVGVATKSRLDDPERAVATVSLTVNFERAGQQGDLLIAEAQVRSGRRIASCEVLVRNEAGLPIGSGMATLSVR